MTDLKFRYRLSEEDWIEALLCLDYRRSGKFRQINIWILSILGAAALIAYIRSPDKFFLFLFLAVIILLDFYMAYGMDFLRNRKARKLASMQGEYEIEISDRQIVYREGQAKIKYSGAKIKWFRSDHVYVLKIERELFVLPRRILGTQQAERLETIFKNTNVPMIEIRVERRESIWERKKKTVKTVDLKLRKGVFFPPWILLAAMVVVSLTNGDAFLAGLNAVTSWVLDNFAWAFNLTALGSVITVIVIWFSPLGKVRIGGSKARPMMKYMDLVWITLCTIIAAGILFWACAEPMYHLYTPAVAAGVESGSADAAVFAMETMYLEWTITPCAIYVIATLTFAFVYYNMNQSFSLGSALVPAFGVKAKKFGGIVDVICLFSLVAGMAASIGTSVMSIGGGVESVFG